MGDIDMKKLILCLSTICVLSSCNRGDGGWTKITAEEGDKIYEAMKYDLEIPDNLTIYKHQKRVETCQGQAESTKTFTFDGVSRKHSRQYRFIKNSALLPLDWHVEASPSYTLHTEYHFVGKKDDQWGLWFLKDNHALSPSRTVKFTPYDSEEIAVKLIEYFMYNFFQLNLLYNYAFDGEFIERIIEFHDEGHNDYNAAIELDSLPTDDKSLRMMYIYDIPKMSEIAKDWGYHATNSYVYREWRKGLPYSETSNFIGVDYDDIHSKDWNYQEDIEYSYDYTTKVQLVGDELKAYNDPEGWAAEK